jgi:hypothetical protein
LRGEFPDARAGRLSGMTVQSLPMRQSGRSVA